MSMLIEFLKAAALAGIPVAMVTFGMILIALRKDLLGEQDGSHGSVEHALKSMKRKDRKDHSKVGQGDLLHKNWLKFGGGFYGIVALLTYALVELNEIIQFFNRFDGFSHFIEIIGIGLIVDFFINSLMNFITAITWPVHWMDEIDSNHIAVWFVAAYLGYRAGIRIAAWYHTRVAEDIADLDLLEEIDDPDDPHPDQLPP